MAQEWDTADVAGVLREPTGADDKYSRGVVGLRTGSPLYPGAAVLGVEAAWRTGVGMVRYLGPTRAADLVLHRRPETVTAPGRVQAWVIGSGTDAGHRSEDETAALRGILSGGEPVVVDAGALDLAIGATAPRVVTPHDREHERLRRMRGLAPVSDRADGARETAAVIGAVVVLKGSETIVAAPSGWSTTLSPATPWLATAGTGDVLAGAIGAVIAGRVAAWPDDAGPGEGAGRGSGDELARLAAAGVWLHGRAGGLAAERVAPGGGPITALDVAEALPRAVGEALATARTR